MPSRERRCLLSIATRQNPFFSTWLTMRCTRRLTLLLRIIWTGLQTSPNPNRRKYAAMATALDDGVGQVLQALQGQNLLSNTLVFFLSDNGAKITLIAPETIPLRGYKFDVLEGGIHVPFAVQWTGRLPGNNVYDEPVSSLDIVATAAAAAGVQLPADRVYDGFNLIPFLAREQVAPPRTLFWRWFGLGASGPPCGGAPGISGSSPDTIWAVRSGVLKLVAARGTTSQPASLYNLQTDIGETQDLAAAQHGDVNTLTSLYNQWNSETIPPLWLDNTDANILPLVLAGDWNGYNKGDTTFPWRLTRITAPGVEGTPDAFNWFKNTIHVATTGGDTTPGLHSFALVGDNSYSKQWGGVTINVDGTTSVPFFSGNVLGPTNSISFQNGYYYSFRILDWINQIGASMKLAVMKTSAPPITVRLNGQTPTTPTSDDSVNIGILTNQPEICRGANLPSLVNGFFHHIAHGRGGWLGTELLSNNPRPAGGNGCTGPALQHQRLISRRSSRRGQLTRLPWQPAATLTSWWLKEQTRARLQPQPRHRLRLQRRALPRLQRQRDAYRDSNGNAYAYRDSNCDTDTNAYSG